MIAISASIFARSQDRYYNDYRTSVNNLDWNAVGLYLNLNKNQMVLMADLNRRYPSYDSWAVVYRSNPDRWYRDRYYRMQQIMTPKQYKKFYKRYYKGKNPMFLYDNRPPYGRYENYRVGYGKYKKSHKKHWKHDDDDED